MCVITLRACAAEKRRQLAEQDRDDEIPIRQDLGAA